MDQKLRCQSCGMPMAEGFFGTNADGSESQEYCKFCWQNGEFTNPNQTLQQMIDLSVENMTQELKMPEPQARTLANEYIPKLKRWQ